MKINVYRSREKQARVAILNYFFGEGVVVETYTRPVLNAADLRTLAVALLIAADGLERGDAPERVRGVIENPSIAAPHSILLKQIDESLRLILRGGELFMLLSKYMPTQFGQYVWNCTRIGCGTGSGGFANTQNEGFAAAEHEAELMQRGATLLAKVVKAVDALAAQSAALPVDDIDPDDPDFAPTRLGGNPQADPQSIPDDVLEGLSVVRKSAVTNMLDRRRVMAAMEDEGFLGSAVWIEEHPDQYMDALNEMGRVVSQRDEPRNDF